ncbi:SDR family oxidoreductase [Cumulibacter manganitolerans]|uniref:SDR family oxidoreductase n=1 Tax=Cumulibacter manganitolerans TaxID=1884992 RepID=UPI001294E368|nr:SDR family oxidoreductase [Cumulibacter manganitolerans]
MTIAITGATGALGSLVLESLLRTERPADLVAVVRDPAKASGLAERGVAVRTATYDDPEALRAALAGVETLLLISGSEVGRRVRQHANVIEAATQAGVRRIVYTSAPKATDTPLVLAPEHKATEELLAASGLAVTILRNNWYNENYLPQVDAVRHTGILLGAAGDGRVASAARRDFAEAAAAVLTGDGHEGRIYELTGDTAWTYDDLAGALSEVVGRDVVYKPVSAAELVTALLDAGLDEGSARFVAALDENIADGALGDVDPTLGRLIGRPTTPLVETLRG